MSTPKNIPQIPEPNSDPKTDNPGQDPITNSEESAKVINTDGAIGDTIGMDESEPSSATAAETETSAGDTATDADVAGGNPVI